MTACESERVRRDGNKRTEVEQGAKGAKGSSANEEHACLRMLRERR